MVGWDGGLNVDPARRSRKLHSYDVMAVVETSRGTENKTLHYVNGKPVKSSELKKAPSSSFFVYFGDRPVEVKITGDVLDANRTLLVASLAHPYRDDPYTF